MKKIVLFAFALIAAAVLRAEDAPKPKPHLGYQDTPMQANGKWHVHDGERPQPTVVTPGEQPGQAPSDAIVLFDGKDTEKWCDGKGQPSKWIVENGYMQVNGGEIQTKDQFGDMQLHIEFATPNPPKGDGQGRGNSGVFLCGRYEFQVLDSFNNPTYPDGQAAAIYSQTPPLVNASRKPGEWQTYDIVFIAPRFEDGKLKTPAYVTAFHNGVLVHNKYELTGTTPHKAVGKYTPHEPKGPIKLQDHGNPMRFRNIWVRAVKGYDEP
jgi:hypothetical protein